MSIFDEVISLLPADWDFSIQSLPDDLLDATCYAWLEAHPHWLPDIFPECASGAVPVDTRFRILETLYLDGIDQMFNDVMADARSAYTKVTGTSEQEDPDSFYWSEAVGDFNYLARSKGFANWYRSGIYLYLERRLEEELLEAVSESQPKKITAKRGG